MRKPLVLRPLSLWRRFVLQVRRLYNILGFGLRAPFLGWVTPRISPEGVVEKLALDPKRPVCYVLATRSLADFVVLQRSCRRLGLPSPYYTERRLPTPEHPTCVFLPPQLSQEASVLDFLVQRAFDRKEFDAQIVPVSLYWGRDPGSETSLLRVLFSDNPLAGSLRKLLIILINGRNAFMHFSQPVNVRRFIGEGEPLDEARAAQKLKRLLRVHFNRERVVALGPSLSRRTLVLHSLLGSPGVQRAMHESVIEDKQTLEKVRARALRYGDEIAADTSSIAIRFVALVLDWVLPRILTGVKVHNFDRMRGYARDHAIVYLPAHRSHLDYLLVSLTIYQQGLACPHIAAGINMNFWPVGILLRRCGAFYLRRSFAGNKLYTAVFRAYVDQLIARGHGMEFFPEGTRSRTGRMLHPRTGMLSMVVLSFLRDPSRPVAIAPVHVAYDKVVEVNSYFKELRGAGKKKAESVGGLLKARKVMDRSNGRAYLSFGAPIRLRDYLDAQVPDWRQRVADETPDSRTSWIQQVVSSLGKEVTVSINANATLTPTGLVALSLLASPQFALAERDLLDQIELTLGLLRTVPYGTDVSLPAEPAAELLDQALRIGQLTRVTHPWGDVILAEDRQAVLLTYARNSVLHLAVLPSLVARFFRNHDELDEQTVIRRGLALYPFLRSELFLPWSDAEAAALLQLHLDALVERGLLLRDRERGVLRRPEITAAQFASLIDLGRVMRSTLERLNMTTLVLAERDRGGQLLERGEFESECRLMAERVGIISGLNSPEFSDPVLFRNYVETLKSLGLVGVEVRDEKEYLRADAKLHAIAQESMDLVDPDVLRCILQTLNRPTR